MKPRDINWGLIGAILYSIVILALIIMAGFSVCGCTQVIIDKKNQRHQVNTFLQKLEFNRLQTAGILLEDYTEEPGKAKAKVNPLIQNYEVEIGDD